MREVIESLGGLRDLIVICPCYILCFFSGFSVWTFICIFIIFNYFFCNYSFSFILLLFALVSLYVRVVFQFFLLRSKYYGLCYNLICFSD